MLVTEGVHAMRHTPTRSEGALWLLSGGQLGIGFRRQVPLGSRHVADFLAPSAGLVVEVSFPRPGRPARIARRAESKNSAVTVPLGQAVRSRSVGVRLHPKVPWQGECFCPYRRGLNVVDRCNADAPLNVCCRSTLAFWPGCRSRIDTLFRRTHTAVCC